MQRHPFNIPKTYSYPGLAHENDSIHVHKTCTKITLYFGIAFKKRRLLRLIRLEADLYKLQFGRTSDQKHQFASPSWYHHFFSRELCLHYSLQRGLQQCYLQWRSSFDPKACGVIISAKLRIEICHFKVDAISLIEISEFREKIAYFLRVVKFTLFLFLDLE